LENFGRKDFSEKPFLIFFFLPEFQTFFKQQSSFFFYNYEFKRDTCVLPWKAIEDQSERELLSK